MSGPGSTQGRPDAPRRDEAEAVSAPVDKRGSEVLDDVDGLLDEIDAVLESNAEEFVRGYVQKGGE